MNRTELTEKTETLDQRAEALIRIAQTLATDWPRFVSLLKPEQTRRGVSAFRAELRSRAFAELCQDYSAKRIFQNGDIDTPKMDYHLGGTMVEVALDLRENDGTFERGILKALMAQGEGLLISRLIFVGKTGARSRCHAPFRKAAAEWVQREHGLEVEVRELGPSGECIFDTSNE